MKKIFFLITIVIFVLSHINTRDLESCYSNYFFVCCDSNINQAFEKSNITDFHINIIDINFTLLSSQISKCSTCNPYHIDKEYKKIFNYHELFKIENNFIEIEKFPIQILSNIFNNKEINNLLLPLESLKTIKLIC